MTSYTMLKDCEDCKGTGGSYQGYHVGIDEDEVDICLNCQGKGKVSAEISIGDLIQEHRKLQFKTKGLPHLSKQENQELIEPHLIELGKFLDKKVILSSDFSNDRIRILKKIDDELKENSSYPIEPYREGVEYGLEKAKQIFLEMVKVNEKTKLD